MFSHSSVPVGFTAHALAPFAAEYYGPPSEDFPLRDRLGGHEGDHSNTGVHLGGGPLLLGDLCSETAGVIRAKEHESEDLQYLDDVRLTLMELNSRTVPQTVLLLKSDL